MNITASKVIRWSGIAAIIAGIIFAGIQPIHPPDVLASVGTRIWSIIMPLKLTMCLLFLVSITGFYARHVEKIGWLGLIGFVLFSISWWLQTGYVFVETLVLPSLTTAAPQYVESVLGIINGVPRTVNVGFLPAIYNVGSMLYLLGSLLFGIAMFRARIMPRWAAGLFAFSGPLAIVMVALLPHQLERLAAMPMGLALGWLGYALWSEQSTHLAHDVVTKGNQQFVQTTTK